MDKGVAAGLFLTILIAGIAMVVLPFPPVVGWVMTVGGALGLVVSLTPARSWPIGLRRPAEKDQLAPGAGPLKLEAPEPEADVAVSDVEPRSLGRPIVPIGDDNKLVFVSYAHEDRTFLDEELMPFLRQLELGEQIELWQDRLIGTGEDWYAEIAGR